MTQPVRKGEAAILWSLHFWEEKKKKTAPWGNLYCFSIVEMFYYFPYKVGHIYYHPRSGHLASTQHMMLFKLDYKPVFVFNLYYSI